MKANIYETRKGTGTHSTTHNIYGKQNNSNNNSSRIDAAYSSSYTQAYLILKAVQLNGRRRLTTDCVYHLANSVARSWESNPDQEQIEALVKLMTNLLDSTLLCPERPLDDALQQFCRNHVPTQSVSPSVTLLIALEYIERLKKKYHNIKGTSGCGHRLIMVAYMMAAKYMHVNLRSIIQTSPPDLSDNKDTPSASTKLPPIMPLCREQTTLLPSPPTSPKAHHLDSDPLKYHYFRSPNKPIDNNTNSNNRIMTAFNCQATAHQTTSASSSLPPSPSLPDKAIDGLESPTVNKNERHNQILRMEHEFLHFLSYDLSSSDILKQIRWAHSFEHYAYIPLASIISTSDSY
ncbi:hypothetical protein A0J61_08649 [Choanephora cucurbitarum]|uniref:Cyclin N-terminal domain-containing protein n=1 Tax=Choanephora cucurbitarum TaxID=101091 RepID=A0A1C7N2H8_9FUNG|nr:hypothetical protein A0J61_08649 [Choanephora cucurbitarum]